MHRKNLKLCKEESEKKQNKIKNFNSSIMEKRRCFQFIFFIFIILHIMKRNIIIIFIYSNKNNKNNEKLSKEEVNELVIFRRCSKIKEEETKTCFISLRGRYYIGCK